MADEDLYKTLGVTPEAEDFVIRAAYKALAQRYHPDRLDGLPEQAHQKMSAINRAYETLGDPTKRKEYDDLWRSSRVRSKGNRQAKGETDSRKPSRPKHTSPEAEGRPQPKPKASANNEPTPKPSPPEEESSWFNWQSALTFAAIILVINLSKSWVSESTYKSVAQQVVSQPISSPPAQVQPPVQPNQAPTGEWQPVASAQMPFSDDGI